MNCKNYDNGSIGIAAYPLSFIRSCTLFMSLRRDVGSIAKVGGGRGLRSTLAGFLEVKFKLFV